MRVASMVIAAMLVADGAGAQTRPPVAPPGLLKGLTKPQHTQMLPGAEGGGGPTHPMPGNGFSITDGVTTGVTFLVVADQTSRATAADRYSLAPGKSGTFRCGQMTCVVRYAARGAVQQMGVARGRAYRFQWLNGRFDLYAMGGAD